MLKLTAGGECPANGLSHASAYFNEYAAVRLEHDRSRLGQDAIDTEPVGLFDQRGADFLTGGFRGWSGGARSGFFVAMDNATPGYIRGPLSPGQWQVILGCPVLASDRCRYWVDVSIDVDPDAADPESPAVEATPLAAQTAQRASGTDHIPSRWYRGALHSHTVHSDGYNTIDEYVAEAQRVGLDFLAITDHNTCSHFQEIAGRSGGEPLLIPGEEVTTAWGHASARCAW